MPSSLLRQSPSGRRSRLTTEDVDNASALFPSRKTLRELLDSLASGQTFTSPVFVESYLARAQNDIRSAIRNCWLDNPEATWFIYPPGPYPFVGPMLTLADGLRNGTRHTGQGTELFRDLGGVPTGQNIFFYRSETDSRHADSIVFEGFRMSLYNALTSFFGFALGLESASRCVIADCEFLCTLVPTATQGRLRWGAALFGGDQTAQPSAGTKNRFERITLFLSQLQGCGRGRSVNGLLVTDTLVQAANDLAISVVSNAGFSIQNVVIENTICQDVAGGGVVFVGGDGSNAGAAPALLRNVLIDGVLLDGARTPDLDFQFGQVVLVDGGVLTENVTIRGVQTSLSPAATFQAKSIVVQSNAFDEVSWKGLTISDCELGVVTSNDPLEALFITGKNMSSVKVTNLHVHGQRGIRISNCDEVALENVHVDDGSILIQTLRNVKGYTLSNCTAKNSRGFNPALLFLSSNGSSFDDVLLSNLVLEGTNAGGLLTQLSGGTMAMSLSNVNNVSRQNPSAETLLGIVRFSNLRGFIVPTITAVNVPAVAAGSIDYASVNLAGSRLGDLEPTEGVGAAPTTRLSPPGPGGGFLYARVTATGVVECAFLGPLPASTTNFSFWRTN